MDTDHWNNPHNKTAEYFTIDTTESKARGFQVEPKYVSNFTANGGADIGSNSINVVTPGGIGGNKLYIIGKRFYKLL